jgi:pimeloyl-ACP methyl ester carboxylesterase
MIYQYDNVPIYYTLSGEGPPLVLLHGFLESASIWVQLLHWLESQYTIITIDLPGHGKSPILADVHSMELFAAVTHSLLQFLNIEKATFLGHSMGGYVALAIADSYPEKVARLLLLNSTPRPDNAARRENRLRALEVLSTNPKAFIRMAIANLFNEDGQSRHSETIKLLQREALDFPIEGIQAAIRGMMVRPDRSEVLKKFAKTSAIIAGSNDPIVPLEELQTVSEQTGTILTIWNGGHMGWCENRENLLEFMHFVE